MRSMAYMALEEGFAQIPYGAGRQEAAWKSSENALKTSACNKQHSKEQQITLHNDTYTYTTI